MLNYIRFSTRKGENKTLIEIRTAKDCRLDAVIESVSYPFFECEGTERGNSEFYRNFRTFRGSRTSGFVTGYFQIDFGGVGEPFVGACFAKSEVYKMK